MNENTYWNSKGKHQQYVDDLNAMVPDEGSVPEPRKNKALEKFRKASNCYYDLYNNGLCNRAREFASVFGIRSSFYKIGQYNHSQALYDETEKVMDQIIINAAAEQGLIKEVA